MKTLCPASWKSLIPEEEAKAMWQILRKFQPKTWMWKKIVSGLVLCGVGVLAYCLGRLGGTSGDRSEPSERFSIPEPILTTSSHTDYQRRQVATIFNNIPITREDLGEYLIARFGLQRVEFLVNRRIVEHACQAKGITVSAAEIEYQFQKDLESFGGKKLTQNDFVNQILRRFNKTLYEWKEDVIRPKLMLTKLARPRVQVTEEDLKKLFEAKYGDKRECRMIVFPPGTDQTKMQELWTKVSKSEDEFREAARNQFVPNLAANGGKLPYPIHRHFADGKEVEKEAFSLKEGEVSGLMQLPDKSWIILKCDKHLPPDTTKSMAHERLALQNEVREMKLQQEAQLVFQELQKTAAPKVHLRDPMADQLRNSEVRPVSYAPRSTPPPLPDKKPN
jgi:hypothetical protein